MESKKKNEKYKCIHCGYIYDPEKGCPKNQIKPGTPFESTPETYLCPQCKSKKAGFELLR
ncbi:MAG: rubredoxin [Elusimicrobiota bacterium]|nr:rubredoxin [Endomicrobiia bacterium]MDW8166822.1 rubredoxin [Elusimicrobiota bacterium]